MICPNCESTFTRIEPNTSCYTCHSCHATFGYIVCSRHHCPRCDSADTSEEEGYFRCNNDDCRFTVCLGYYDLNEDTKEYELQPGCGRKFQYKLGEPVQCHHCHPIGSLSPTDYVACAFTSETDTEVRFPQNVIFPTRSIDEFFRRRAYDLGLESIT